MSEQIIFGIHAVQSLVEKHKERVIRLCVLRDRDDKKIKHIVDIAKQNRINVDYVSKQEIEKLVGDANNQGVVAICRAAKLCDEADLKNIIANLTHPAFLLVLDGVQDPHNLGACFRTADAAGVHAIIAPKDKAVGLTGTVSKVASGAAETVPFIQVTNLARTLQELKELGIWIYGAAGESTETLYQAKLTGPIAIVLGREGEGLRRLTRDHCDFLIRIPMLGTVSSLNVSVATGVFLFEALRQRGAS